MQEKPYDLLSSKSLSLSLGSSGFLAVAPSVTGEAAASPLIG